MPRLPYPLILAAARRHRCLPLLLQECRDLDSARNELRWLQEHVESTVPDRSFREHVLQRFCLERSRGKPLQYILGSQPFGELEILCKPGVLIPRNDTEAWVTRLAESIQARFESSQLDQPLRVLDLCTGSGCIPLLLHSLLAKRFARMEMHGVDMLPNALELARTNLHRNVRSGHLSKEAAQQVSFHKGDVLRMQLRHDWDIIISNPPYISLTSYNKDTSRSVRNYEPKLALVPLDNSGDTFYKVILEQAEPTGVKLVAFEVADVAQAQRVCRLAGQWEDKDIWYEDEQKQSARAVVLSRH